MSLTESEPLTNTTEHTSSQKSLYAKLQELEDGTKTDDVISRGGATDEDSISVEGDVESGRTGLNSTEILNDDSLPVQSRESDSYTTAVSEAGREVATGTDTDLLENHHAQALASVGSSTHEHGPATENVTEAPAIVVDSKSSVHAHAERPSAARTSREQSLQIDTVATDAKSDKAVLRGQPDKPLYHSGPLPGERVRELEDERRANITLARAKLLDGLGKSDPLDYYNMPQVTNPMTRSETSPTAVLDADLAWDLAKVEDSARQIYDFDGKIAMLNQQLKVLNQEPIPGLDQQKLIESTEGLLDLVQRSQKEIGEQASQQALEERIASDRKQAEYEHTERARLTDQVTDIVSELLLQQDGESVTVSRDVAHPESTASVISAIHKLTGASAWPLMSKEYIAADGVERIQETVWESSENRVIVERRSLVNGLLVDATILKGSDLIQWAPRDKPKGRLAKRLHARRVSQGKAPLRQVLSPTALASLPDLPKPSSGYDRMPLGWAEVQDRLAHDYQNLGVDAHHASTLAKRRATKGSPKGFWQLLRSR